MLTQLCVMISYGDFPNSFAFTINMAGREGGTEEEGYTFHERCGTRAKLSNGGRTAERLNPSEEFNNAVVMGGQPLEEGRRFEVKIDAKTSTWSGSILIGVTTTRPESFRFPSSISGLSSGSWVFNGECIWKDGKRTVEHYGSQLLDNLIEGDTVGVVRKSDCLHFFINGEDQGVVESRPPPGGVYPLVDLYGKCTKATIVQTGNAALSNDGSATLAFHSRCGRMAEVIEGGTVALRKNCHGEFNHGVVLSSRPLRDSELFEIQITRMVDKWAGSIEMGITTHSPEALEFPSTMTNMHSGTWIMSGSGILQNGDTIRENFGRSLDSLKTGERIGVMRRPDSSLVFFINGREIGVASTGIPPLVYGVVDLYGRCAEVRITNGVASDIGTPVDMPVASVSSLDLDSPMCFHQICGENAEVSADGLSASRVQPYDEFTRATVFSNRPLKPDEWFEVSVSITVDPWSGSLQMGVCKVPPEHLNFDEFEEISDRESTWILSGAEIFQNGNPTEAEYPLDLDEVPLGSKVAVMVTSSGNLHFALNGVDMGCATRDIPTGVYGVVDIYGQCAQVTLVDRHDNARESSHVTEATPTPSNPNLPAVIPTVEAILGPLDHGFHPRRGRNVRLSENLSVATRVTSYKDGVVFSARPLKDGDIFKVELVKQNDAWKGQLRVGLTTCNPSKLAAIPSLCTQLPPHAWIVNGTSVLVDGRVVMETYGRSLNRLQVGNIVGVQRSAEGAMHVYIDEQDLGPAVHGIPEKVYAVVDLYGAASCVKIASNMESELTEEGLPMAEGTSASPSEGVTSFSTLCGQNILLSQDLKTARRVRSYSKGIVVSSSPLPNDKLFQIEIKQLEKKWSGSVMIGVTSLPPERACQADKASDLRGQSFIVCAHNGATCLFIGGQEKLQLPKSVDLLSLKATNTIGILCKANGTLHLFINGHNVAHVPSKVPKNRYAVVDLYGRCCEVELKPLVAMSRKTSATHPHTANRHSDQSSPAARVKWLRQHQGSAGTVTVENGPPSRGSEESSMDARVHVSPVKTRQNVVSPCAYQQLCERYMKTLGIPEPYFDRTPAYTKCYCERCNSLRGNPRVKLQGDPPIKYTVTVGWVKFALRVGPQAEVMDIFNKWHVAYHGTSAGNVRHILDCGGLMLPGDFTIGRHQVKRPEGHFNEKFKPKDFDVNQIFVSPSIKYSTEGEVYAKGHRYTDVVTGKTYWAKVAFKLRIHPESYQVSSQTVQATAGVLVDEHFSNSELEWGTKQRRAVILYGLLVKLQLRQ